MTTSKEIDPHLLAAYDQAFAGSLEYLDGLIDAYVLSRSDGVQESVSAVICAQVLHTELPPQVLAGALATAVVRMAREVGDGSR
jgi:hypothetical protein